MLEVLAALRTARARRSHRHPGDTRATSHAGRCRGAQRTGGGADPADPAAEPPAAGASLAATVRPSSGCCSRCSGLRSRSRSGTSSSVPIRPSSGGTNLGAA